MSQQDLASLIRTAAARFGEDLARTITQNLSAALTQQLGGVAKQAQPVAVGGPKRRQSRPYVSKLTYWKADKDAKRVPLFVIEQTGLTTKQEIIAKYGANAEFRKKDVDAVAAKAPVIRKAQQHPADEVSAALR